MEANVVSMLSAASESIVHMRPTAIIAYADLFVVAYIFVMLLCACKPTVSLGS